MIGEDALESAMVRLSALRYWPAAVGAQAVAVEILERLCADDEALDRVVTAILDTHDEWPGPASFKRLVYDITHDDLLYPRKQPQLVRRNA